MTISRQVCRRPHSKPCNECKRKLAPEAIQVQVTEPLKLDRLTNCIRSTMRMTDNNGPATQVRNLLYLGREQMVGFYCIVPADQADVLVPRFDEIIYSFQFDAGYAFQPAMSAARRQEIVNVVVGILEVGFIGTLLLAALYTYRKRSSPVSTNEKPSSL
jgi:hypothetical protein